MSFSRRRKMIRLFRAIFVLSLFKYSATCLGVATPGASTSLLPSQQLLENALQVWGEHFLEQLETESGKLNFPRRARELIAQISQKFPAIKHAHLKDDNGLLFGEEAQGIDRKLLNALSKVNAKRGNDSYLEKIRKVLANRLVEMTHDNGAIPSQSEFMAIFEYSARDMDVLFGAPRKPGTVFDSYKELRALAADISPSKIRSAHDPDSFPENYDEMLLEALRKSDKIIVTTAIKTFSINDKFYQSLLNYQKYWKEVHGQTVSIFTYIQNGPFQDFEDHDIASRFMQPNKGLFIIDRTLEVHPDLIINAVPLQAKLVNPTAGFDRYQPFDRTQIIMGRALFDIPRYAETQQNELNSTRLLTTGTVSNPDFAARALTSQRTDYMSRQDFNYGFVLLEKHRSNSSVFGGDFEVQRGYRITQVEWDDLQGYFAIGGLRFTHQTKSLNGKLAPTTQKAAALVLGDIHLSHVHPRALASALNLVRKYNPKELILHDFLDNQSISHWESEISSGIKKSHGKDKLYSEIALAVSFLKSLAGIRQELASQDNGNEDFRVVIVRSNHNDWISRYVKDGRHIGTANQILGQKILTAMEDRQRNWLKELLTGDLLREVNANAPVLTQKEREILIVKEFGQPHRIGEYEVGQHGDQKPNGGRGGLGLPMLRKLGNLISGHVHYKARGPKGCFVGRLMDIADSYAECGFTNTSLGAAIIYPSGLSQHRYRHPSTFTLLSFENGSWEHSPTDVAGKNFFPRGFPKLGPVEYRVSDDQRGQVDNMNSWAGRCY